MPSKELPTAQRPEVVDPNNVPVLFVDWIVTGGVYEGAVNLSLGAIDHSLRRSDDELARVMVAARLRCSETFAYRLWRVLGDILKQPPPQGDQETGPPPATPPKNLIN